MNKRIAEKVIARIHTEGYFSNRFLQFYNTYKYRKAIETLSLNECKQINICAAKQGKTLIKKTRKYNAPLSIFMIKITFGINYDKTRKYSLYYRLKPFKNK